MAGCAVQKDNDDSFGSLLYHLDDNNAFPERAAVAVRLTSSFSLATHLLIQIRKVLVWGRAPATGTTWTC
jgi:hypothetical protein